MQVYVNCKLYSMQHAYIIFLYYTIPTLSDYQKQGYFNKHGHFFLWSGETTTCRSLQALQRKFGDWSLWCVFSSLGPSFWSLFLGATGFGREVVDSLVLKKCILYPDFEKMLQTSFSFFFLGGSGRLWSFWDMFFLSVEHMGVPTMSQHQGSWVRLWRPILLFHHLACGKRRTKWRKNQHKSWIVPRFFRCFWIFFSVVVERIFLFSPLFGEDSLQPESHELFHFFFRCFWISYECLWSGWVGLSQVCCFCGFCGYQYIFRERWQDNMSISLSFRWLTKVLLISLIWWYVFVICPISFRLQFFISFPLALTHGLDRVVVWRHESMKLLSGSTLRIARVQWLAWKDISMCKSQNMPHRPWLSMTILCISMNQQWNAI